eukprot:m51a1_g12580 hypothetical protein (80) ;mRNA; r:170-707
MSRRKDAAALSFLSNTDISEKSVANVPLTEGEGTCLFSFTAPYEGRADEGRPLFLGDSVAALTASNYPTNGHSHSRSLS